jgi:hypothetical protein
VDGNHRGDGRGRRGRGRSRTPRKNVNGCDDGNSTGESRRRRPRTDRGSTSSGNSTDHTEPIFQSGEAPYMGFCSPTRTAFQEQKGNRMSLAADSTSLSPDDVSLKKRREFKPTPRSHWTCQERDNSNQAVIVIGHEQSPQKTRYDQQIHHQGGEINDTRDDDVPTALIAPFISVAPRSFADSTASTQRARGSRRCQIEQHPIFIHDDRKWTVSVSSMLQSFSPASFVDSMVSNPLMNIVTSDDEIRDESSGTEKSCSGSTECGAMSQEGKGPGIEKIVSGESSKCLSPKTKQRSKRSKSASKFLKKKMRSLSRLVYGRRISNRIHQGKEE